MACSYAVGPADEKLVITPLRPVGMSSNEREMRTVVRPPVRGQVRTQRGGVGLADHPGRDLQLDRDRVRLAGAVVDDHDADRAGGDGAACLRHEACRRRG